MNTNKVTIEAIIPGFYATSNGFNITKRYSSWIVEPKGLTKGERVRCNTFAEAKAYVKAVA